MGRTIKQLTAAPTGKVLQELRNLIISFEQNGYEIGAGMHEFLEYMNGLNLQKRQREQEWQAAQAKYAESAPPCPHCNTPMWGYEVNTEPGNQVNGRWRSQWVCPNPECLWEEFSVLTPEERFGNSKQAQKELSDGNTEAE